MSSIALFPCLCTPNAGIIDELSTRLDLQVYTDDNLINDTSNRFGNDEANLKKMMFGKTSVFNQFTLEKERTVSMFRTVLAEKLQEQDRYLFYGFHTLLIPPDVSEVLRVLVVDTRQSRIDCCQKEGLSIKEVKRKVRMHDVSAYSWSDFLSKKEAYDRSLYDLVLPVESRDHKELSDEILKLFYTTSILRTEKSQQGVRNLATKAAVKRVLLEKGHNLGVTADGNDIVITIHNAVFNLGSLEVELTKLAKTVPGVENVTLQKSKAYKDSIYRAQKFELPSKVLFVDDEKDFVQTVSQRLISRDVGTYGVFNGEEALELICEDTPEVMVLDLKMPGINGIEVLRRTKEIAPGVEIIILTGHGTVKDERECMELGAFAYLNKPVDIEELSATIKAANEKIRTDNIVT
ncbi:MAG: response regulator [Desulfobacterales bacterium]|nr:MAG: response regulator [Desulfobacterales bacterium]